MTGLVWLGMGRGDALVAMKTIYRITYPNGNIYIGQDRTNTLKYFGSADSKPIEHNFPPGQCRDFGIRKEILWESETASDSEVNLSESPWLSEKRNRENFLTCFF
jgi:hypothetical protein